MTHYQKILCPVDLSDNSLLAIELATTIALANNAVVVFMFVAPQWPPNQANIDNEFVQEITEDHKNSLYRLRPTNPKIECEHLFRHGNAGPEIVRESNNCDLIVMSTHGYGGILRLLMGSVAQYTMRNAKCPVVTMRVPEFREREQTTPEDARKYVTDVMHHAAPIQELDNINHVIAKLNHTRETAVPVVNSKNECVGILTSTDIAHYQSLLSRFEDKDEQGINEMFATALYGDARPGTEEFDHVIRYMSSPVVTIRNSATIVEAKELFAANDSIHHVVIVDESNHCLGIMENFDCQPGANLECSS